MTTTTGTKPTAHLARRSTFQVAAATSFLEGIIAEHGKTTVTFNVPAAEVVTNIDHVLANDSDATDKGIRVALHSLRRAVAKLAESDAHVAAAASLADAKPEGAKARIARLAHTDPNEPAVAEDGPERGDDGAFLDRQHRLTAARGETMVVKRWKKAGSKGDRPATPNLDAIEAESGDRTPSGAKKVRKRTAKASTARKQTSGSSTTDGPPPRCPGGGQKPLGGAGSTSCPVCTQDAATVKRDGTLGSHKLLKPRDGSK
jgi:hypothetical protein